MKEAYFAGGCFWCVTPIYKMYGVEKVICGYAGGDEENPTYEQVKHQQTGHRETIKLVYDPEKVSYEKLLDIYFANVDPFDGEKVLKKEDGFFGDDEPPAAEIPVHPGYRFVRWDRSVDEKRNVTYTAVWDKKVVIPKTGVE